LLTEITILDNIKRKSVLVHLEDNYILSRIYLGARLTITFQNRIDMNDRRVLELAELVGFIDQSTGDEAAFLHIDESGSSYTHDLSLRLQRPEIIDFPVVFLFTDPARTQFSFRACAKAVHFRE
jgi:hypothetical protein